jgi:hypothetical protein
LETDQVKGKRKKMFKLIPETILTERQILHRTESTGAILHYLPNFLHSLANTQGTSYPVALIESELKKAGKTFSENIFEAKEWIRENIGKLKLSPFAKHPLVAPSIAKAESSLEWESNDSPEFFLNQNLFRLQLAVTAVAAFGNDSLFDEWVVIGEARKESSEIAPRFLKKSHGLIPIKNRWKLANHFGHGVDSWRVVPTQGTRENGKLYPPYITITYGIFVKFIFPSFFKSLFIWKNPECRKKWREKRESDAVTLFKFLKILSNYGSQESLKDSLLWTPKSIEEAEEFFIQGEVKPYLQKLSSPNCEDHPFSRSQLLDLIDTFLNMLETRINQYSSKLKQAKSPIQKNDPRQKDKKIALEWLKTEWIKNKDLNHGMIVDKLMKAIRNQEIKLERPYKRSTYEDWAKDADSLPLPDKLRRSKTKNVPNRAVKPFQ